MNKAATRLLTASLLVLTSFAAAQNTITVATTSNGEHLDPHRGLNYSANIIAHIFDGLTRLDPDGSLQPGLAESWESVDDLTWRFTIRQGVTFHNGEPLDAEVVRLNLDRLKSATQSRTSWAAAIDSYEVVDEYTIDIRTAVPFPLLPGDATGIYIAPASYLPDPDSDSTEFNRHPVGTGPFSFVEDVRGEQIRLAVNEDYWRGRPEADELVFRVIPDAAVQVAELLTGGVDIVENVPPELIGRIEAGGAAHIVDFPSPVSHIVQFRLDLDTPLQDVRVRQAVNYAVDLDSIIANVLGGYASPLATVVIPGSLGYNEDIAPYPYDPDRARDLLAEAGYSDGVTLTFEYSPAIGELYSEEVILAIASQLAEVGIDINLVSLEYGVAVQRVYGDRTANEIFRWQWKTWFDDPASILRGFYHSEGSASFNDDPDIDEQLDYAEYLLDSAERARVYHELQAKIHGEALSLPLYNLDSLYGVSNRIAEYHPRVDGRLGFVETTFR